MSNKLYVGNMPYSTTEEALQQMFSEYGAISEVKIIKDHMSNRSKGFGFVTYEDASSCQGAIDALNGYEMDGRTLKVNIAEERAKKKDFSSGGGGNRGGYNNNRKRY